MKKLTFAVSLLSLALLPACVKELKPGSEDISREAGQGQETTSQESSFRSTDKHVPNELLVKFKRGLSQSGRENALARIAGNVKEQVVTEAMKNAGDGDGFFVIRTPYESLDAVNRMRGMSEVELAEPNYIYHHIPLADANDPLYNDTKENIWGMMGDWSQPLRAPMGSRAGEAWSGASIKLYNGAYLVEHTLNQQTGSQDVYVGVIDEGIQFNHEDLNGQVRLRLEIPGNKKDDDGNGFKDDAYGWNFVRNNNAVYSRNEDDHGTHVAGTIGAIKDNSKGVTGVCPKISIISAKFLGATGGTTDNAIKALDYITNLKYRADGSLRYNIVATNNSWGGGEKSFLLEQAITRSENKGILFIAAAGNDSKDIDKSPSYPASYPNANIITVGSLWLYGVKSDFSNWGAQTVDIFAPGTRIWSTVPGGYANYSGTSMATPHVTGAVALYAAANNSKPANAADALAIKNAILLSARPTTDKNGTNWKTYCVTGARLDVHSAWQNINNSTKTPDKFEDYYMNGDPNKGPVINQ
ncbi:S8 family serine peptidase [Flavisolibacter sp. BT320]|nr:S8 family serine peptidase [Flavisolibacter longurius]